MVLDMLASLTVWQALAGSLLGLIVLVLLMNRGDMWVLNVLAQDEPLVGAAGIFVFLGAGWLAANVGLSVVLWQIAGIALVVSSIVIVRSDRFDISGLI